MIQKIQLKSTNLQLTACPVTTNSFLYLDSGPILYTIHRLWIR